MASKALHCAVAAHYAYADYHCLRLVAELGRRLYNHCLPPQLFGLQFFTVWGQVLQQSYFLARLVQDLRGDYRGEYALSVLFAGAVLPSSALVAVNYWSLVWVDPGLVDGQGLLDVFPSWLNHVMHSNVVALCLLELACNPRLRYPPRQPGMAVFSLLVSAYLAVCMYALSHDDFWIYPFFKTMSGNQKAAFFIYNYLVGSTVYFTGEWLCGVLRGFRTEKSHLKGNST